MCRRNRAAWALAALALLGMACSPSGPTLTDDEAAPEAASPTAGEASPSPSATVPETPAPTTGPSPTEPPTEDTEEPTPTSEVEPEARPTANTPQPTAEAQSSGEASGSDEPSCTTGLAGQPGSTAEAAGDVDNDGARDLITTYSLIDGSGEVTGWRIRYDTAAGESLDSPVPNWSPGDAVQAIGSADVDGDGETQEAFVVVGAGASASVVSIFVRQGCSIVAATSGDSAATFAVGGGIVNVAGLECVDSDGDGTHDSIVAWSGEADPAAASGTYVIDGVEFELRGTRLVEVGGRRLVANLNSADFAYGQLNCGGLGL